MFCMRNQGNTLFDNYNFNPSYMESCGYFYELFHLIMSLYHMYNDSQDGEECNDHSMAFV